MDHHLRRKEPRGRRYLVAPPCAASLAFDGDRSTFFIPPKLEIPLYVRPTIAARLMRSRTSAQELS
jgi:hypothetical protein